MTNFTNKFNDNIPNILSNKPTLAILNKYSNNLIMYGVIIRKCNTLHISQYTSP